MTNEELKKLKDYLAHVCPDGDACQDDACKVARVDILAKFAASNAFADDIPLDQAIAAHRGTSFVAEDRGQQERAEYANTLTTDLANLAKLADAPDKEATLVTEFARYREGLKAHWLAYLGGRSRCVSTMIAGPSNFNTRRAQKSGDSADRRLHELLDFRKRAFDAIRKTLCPGLRPIMTGDSDAMERLAAEIEKAEKLQALMKAANLIIRQDPKYQSTPEKVAKLVALGMSEETAHKLFGKDFCGRVGFPDYALTNNNANIRRLKGRQVTVERVKATPESEVQGTAARMEVCPAENRIRLHFPGKPSEEVRAKMKGAGFRWKPSASAWSGYINDRTRAVGAEIAGVDVLKAS